MPWRGSRLFSTPLVNIDNKWNPARNILYRNVVHENIQHDKGSNVSTLPQLLTSLLYFMQFKNYDIVD